MTPGFKPFTKKNFVVRNKYMCVCVSLSITITANYFFLTVSNHSGYERQDPLWSYWGLEFVRGSEGYSDKTPTAWLRGGGHPPYQEVVTRFPLCGATELVAYVECIEGQSTLSFGLIVPDDRYLIFSKFAQQESG